MLIDKQKEQVNYLVKMMEKKQKQKSELERKKEFVKDFNEEAKKQNSRWFSEIEPSEYNHLYISKVIESGWWIFKERRKIQLFVGCYDYKFSFVDNDYSTSDYGINRNKRIFHYLPEFKNILKKIKQVFFILPFEEIGNMEIEIARITKDIEKLECRIQQNSEGGGR